MKKETNTPAKHEECSRCRQLQDKIIELTDTINKQENRQYKILTTLNYNHQDQMKAIIVAMKVLTKPDDEITGNEMSWLATHNY